MTDTVWAVLLLLACALIINVQIVADIRQHDRWATDDAEPTIADLLAGAV